MSNHSHILTQLTGKHNVTDTNDLIISLTETQYEHFIILNANCMLLKRKRKKILQLRLRLRPITNGSSRVRQASIFAALRRKHTERNGEIGQGVSKRKEKNEYIFVVGPPSLCGLSVSIFCENQNWYDSRVACRAQWKSNINMYLDVYQLSVFAIAHDFRIILTSEALFS